MAKENKIKTFQWTCPKCRKFIHSTSEAQFNYNVWAHQEKHNRKKEGDNNGESKQV